MRPIQRRRLVCPRETQSAWLGYWGNRTDGYDLHGLVRNDLSEFDWDEDKSTLEFGVGDALEEKSNFEDNERVTLGVRGNPHQRYSEEIALRQSALPADRYSTQLSEFGSCPRSVPESVTTVDVLLSHTLQSGCLNKTLIPCRVRS
uniref:IS1341-type transposase n=1 Tax=uncultured haloarchaeon TaxID=160804 RepID=A5YT13_9EURY|nr:IS1341-type transposase [uncultured haloarchaeon]